MSLQNTPQANRLHIGIFGKRNSGKSSLLNAITGQDIALVSEFKGTTTDPVYKSMEIHGLGPCVFIDTAGIDDEGEIGHLRIEKTKKAIEKTDMALVVFGEDKNLELEKKWIKLLKSREIPVLAILNKSDLLKESKFASENIEKNTGLKPLVVSAKNKQGISRVISSLIDLLPEEFNKETITGKVVKDGDSVLLVMPQDIQAPKGRLILPQVQTIRELLDRKCVVISATAEKFEDALKSLAHPPKVIITDSQVFKTVYEKKPPESKLTSFSILFAGFKGDLDYYVKSVQAIENLKEDSQVLIAEACTHAPLEEDIGREKIPTFLRQKVGAGLTVKVVSGTDFPEDLSSYDLIIHCGGCMFNRRYVLSRIEKAKQQNIPMTNYGVVFAYLAGILDKVDFN